MRFKKQRDQRPQPETPGEQTDKRRQRRFRIIFIVAIVAILGGVWLVRYPRGYVDMFLGHYEGTTSILPEMDGLARTQEDEELLLPLQQQYDDWRQTHLRETLSISATAGEDTVVTSPSRMERYTMAMTSTASAPMAPTTLGVLLVL